MRSFYILMMRTDRTRLLVVQTIGRRPERYILFEGKFDFRVITADEASAIIKAVLHSNNKNAYDSPPGKPFESLEKLRDWLARNGTVSADIEAAITQYISGESTAEIKTSSAD